MAQQIKAPAAKPDILSSIPGDPYGKRESVSQSCLMTSTHVLWHPRSHL